MMIDSLEGHEEMVGHVAGVLRSPLGIRLGDVPFAYCYSVRQSQPFCVRASQALVMISLH